MQHEGIDRAYNGYNRICSVSIYIAGPMEFKSQRRGIDMIGEFWLYHHIYPLVNVYITMENIIFLMGTSTI